MRSWASLKKTYFFDKKAENSDYLCLEGGGAGGRGY